MQIGIIAEGVTDIAVIDNILKAILGIDTSDRTAIRPELNIDETDAAMMPEGAFGSWTLVKKECEARTEIDSFFQIEGERFLIIQIDSDTAQDYGIPPPTIPTNKAEATALRQTIITQIKSWLATTEFDEKIVYAITINAVESWLLTLYPPVVPETGLLPNPKDRMMRAINQLKKKDKEAIFKIKEARPMYKLISKPFSKKKTLKPCLNKNQSLQEFCEDLTAMGNYFIRLRPSDAEG